MEQIKSLSTHSGFRVTAGEGFTGMAEVGRILKAHAYQATASQDHGGDYLRVEEGGSGYVFSVFLNETVATEAICLRVLNPADDFRARDLHDLLEKIPTKEVVVTRGRDGIVLCCRDLDRNIDRKFRVL